ncbi:MAG: hypothetical protein BGO47_10605 [Microbacterium sp. 67-17]|uniref:MMPL family transporter n=1 Tax=Microbacterium sp. 67-17 TaxID=1895782 RepID=UPI000964E5F4|nr:MMPL family transporter [Microbacterium sp. 67-17]OJV97296.1 MAG: hypothetical protein BGO47_10605 [Microbacterium sp. 67-17]
MSLALHRLGHLVARHRLLVIIGWLVVILALLGASRVAGTAYADNFSVPGTESEIGQTVLEERFGSSAAGASAQLLFRTDSGSIEDADAAAVIEDALAEIETIPGVANVSGMDRLQIDENGDAALATVQFEDEKPSDEALDAVHEAAIVDEAGVTSTIGGSAYGEGNPEMSHLSEVIGIAVALLVLFVTFGSFLAAGMPIVAAIAGVGATISILALASHVADISTATPSFSTMLGLAVAIDYSLFILSRHRQELAAGLEPREAMSRALGTAGGAVVFAGLTVIVSLLGLSVVGIPVLTVMAFGGSLAVATAVLVALTLLPAIALLAGTRLTPRVRRARRSASPAPSGRPGFSSRWVRIVTRVPALTIVLVVVGVGALALPATQMALALPDASTKPVGTDSRDHFDAVAETFGPGWNAPLLVTVDILESTDPLETMDDLSAAISEIPGVAAVPVASPNAGADTGLMRVIPGGGQNDPATTDLVHELRERAPDLEEQYGVSDIRVTGTTAINIDTSERLAGALLPFALTVAGLSIVLLMIVFRSIWVPIKATVGFLLSVGAAFGAIVAVFQWGWFPAILGDSLPGPLVSFLPILVMGVLFGLAMDYEMFLVSRMREDYSHTRDAHGAVMSGFRHSAPVVTAAALIMIAVFVAFIPAGSATIKPIAFGLAVGVFVDAFLVRMTLVPAVMTLLGDRAWWLPAWLERILPAVDIEGDALARQVALDESGRSALAISAHDLVVDPGAAALNLAISAGEVASIPVPGGIDEMRLAHVLAGRTRPVSGALAVHGQVLPERAESVRRATAIVTADDVSPGDGTVADYIAATLTTVGGRRPERAARLARAMSLAPATGIPIAQLELSARRQLAAAVALACGAQIVFLPGCDDHGLAENLRGAGATVIMFTVAPAALTASAPLASIGAPA